MAGINDKDAAGNDLQGLIDWLENEQTRDLVDMINRAAQGLPVEEAASKYKARYRHCASMEKLSELFENLEERTESGLEISLRGVMHELDVCLAALQAAGSGLDQMLQSSQRLEQAELISLQLLTNRLRDLQQAANGIREQIIHAGASASELSMEQTRLLGRVNF
jgi:hypothetical protein